VGCELIHEAVGPHLHAQHAVRLSYCERRAVLAAETATGRFDAH